MFCMLILQQVACMISTQLYDFGVWSRAILQQLAFGVPMYGKLACLPYIPALGPPSKSCTAHTRLCLFWCMPLLVQSKLAFCSDSAECMSHTFAHIFPNTQLQLSPSPVSPEFTPDLDCNPSSLQTPNPPTLNPLPNLQHPFLHPDSKLEAKTLTWYAVCSSRGLDLCLQPLPQGRQPPEDAHPAVPHSCADAAGQAALCCHSPQV